MAAITKRKTGNSPLPMMYQPIDIAANVAIDKGHMVCIDTNGRACPVDPTVPTKRVIGVLYKGDSVDNTGGAAAAFEVDGIETGCFEFTNSASGDLITKADIGNVCYAVDGSTVAKTSTQATVVGARPPAGRVFDITESGKVLVVVHPDVIPAADEADLQTWHFNTLKSAGTWTLSESSHVMIDTLTPQANAVKLMADLTTEAKTMAGKGKALRAVTMFYTLGTAALDSLNVSIKKKTLPAHASAVTAAELAGGTTDAHYDANHDTAAERVAFATLHHTLTVTVPTPTVLASNEALEVVATIDGDAGTSAVFIFKGFLASWTQIR